MRRPATPNQRTLRIFIITTAILIGSCFLLARPVIRGFLQSDRDLAMVETATAMVVTLVPAQAKEGYPPTPARAVVRFRGKTLVAKEVFGSSLLKEGSSALITYRVGKSGSIYVDRVEPISDSSQ